MTGALCTFLFLATGQVLPLKAGDYQQALIHENQKRTYVLHVPKGYDAKKPTPLVVALHGASMTARIMGWFTELDKKSDQAGFLIAYPEGTGPVNILLTWNAGNFPGSLSQSHPDDVGFVAKVLDDVPKAANVDLKRIYVTGLSNGGMMTHRVAAELSDRFAAAAPVAGTLALDTINPKRPIPLLHFHGTLDPLVPYDGPPQALKFQSVEKSIAAWVKADHCSEQPTIREIPKTRDDLKVVCKEYSAEKNGAEVILYTIEGGGHTWPGTDHGPALLGRSTMNISANDLMWEFFQKHTLP